jgi:cytosine/uracil/thiamine/allantoin permease
MMCAKGRRSKYVIKRYFGPKMPVWAFCGGLLGALAHVLIADYWLVCHTELRLAGLYRRGGASWYNGGWNDNGVVGFAVALVLYWGLTMVSARRQPAGHASYAGQQG